MTEPEPAKPLPADTVKLLNLVTHAYDTLKTYNEKMALGRALKERIADLNRDASAANVIAKVAKEAAKKAKHSKEVPVDASDVVA